MVERGHAIIFARGANATLPSEPGPTLGRHGRPHMHITCGGGGAGAEGKSDKHWHPQENVALAGHAPRQAGAPASAQWNTVHLF